jgi:hypothetical protein
LAVALSANHISTSGLTHPGWTKLSTAKNVEPQTSSLSKILGAEKELESKAVQKLHCIAHHLYVLFSVILGERTAILFGHNYVACSFLEGVGKYWCIICQRVLG